MDIYLRCDFERRATISRTVCCDISFRVISHSLAPNCPIIKPKLNLNRRQDSSHCKNRRSYGKDFEPGQLSNLPRRALPLRCKASPSPMQRGMMMTKAIAFMDGVERP